MKKSSNYFSHIFITTVSFNKHYQNFPEVAKKNYNKVAYIQNGTCFLLIRVAIGLIAVKTELELLLALLFRKDLTQMSEFHIVTLHCFITRLVRHSSNRKDITLVLSKRPTWNFCFLILISKLKKLVSSLYFLYLALSLGLDTAPICFKLSTIIDRTDIVNNLKMLKVNLIRSFLFIKFIYLPSLKIMAGWQI